eukprot:2133448-Ditylum_brightwellii.AAC.1
MAAKQAQISTEKYLWLSANASDKAKSGKYSDPGGTEDVYIECNSLVKLKHKQGRNESIECYCALALFTKFYTNWYVAEESMLKWAKVQKAKKTHTLAHMVSAPGKAYQEVEPDIGRR